MRKIKLELESLAVETFETLAAEVRGRGTVLGASGIRPASQRPFGCFETENVTGGCCDITLALSCVQTNCDDCIIVP